MTKHELNDLYFDWMYRLVCKKARSYRKLFRQLHDIDFEYLIPMDGNRAEDGVELRYRFGNEHAFDDHAIASYLDDRPCSVLEMLIALAIRCEEHIMDDPEIGDRTDIWFWDMVRNLGLDIMSDSRYDSEYVDVAVDRFMNRDYGRNGIGGLFTVNDNRHDMRSMEIWYQMCAYLEDIV